MKKFLSEYKAILITVTIFVIVVSVFVGFAIKNSIDQKNWLASLSPEELAIYEAEQEAERLSNIHEYELISVAQYVRNVTNGFGGVQGSRVCYTFCFLEDGVLKQVDDFSHYEHGLTKVIIGDSDKYIIDTNATDTYKYLQLTEKTLREMKTLSVN